MKLTQTLDYDLAEGWLAPWVAGVREGRAVASTCGTCGTARFPPLRICPGCNAPSDSWRGLTGRATILFRTTGRDGDFALARFDGSEGAAIVRLAGLPAGAVSGRLLSAPEGPPALILGPEPTT